MRSGSLNLHVISSTRRGFLQFVVSSAYWFAWVSLGWVQSLKKNGGLAEESGRA